MADVEQSKSGSKEDQPNHKTEQPDKQDTKGETVPNGKKKTVQISVRIKGDPETKVTFAPQGQKAPHHGSARSGSGEKPANVRKSNDGKTKDENKKNDVSQNQRSSMSRAKTQLGYIKEPTFVISASNGAGIVESVLNERGWKKISDKQFENFKIKWVECKASINYSSFKEGEQLVNRIPNCSLLTNKMGLLGSLRGYERVCGGMRKAPKLKLTDFVPETYRLDDQKEKEAFQDTFQEGEIWICKPTGMNQGKGIYLVRDMEQLNKSLQERDEKQKMHKRTMGRIIQRYIHNPLLLEDRKFDIRAYMLIASTTPYLVLYHKGYVRLSMVKYENDTSNLIAHLTNQYIQKKDPNYKDNKETTAWSMDRFNDYVNENFAEEKGIETDWVYTVFTTKMKQIMTHCFNAVRHKLECKTGYFDLYGFDFMVDENMKIWLIEVNVNPALAINCEALKEVIPGVIKETINVAIECFEKSKRNQPLMPLESLKNFTILHNGGYGNRSGQNSASPPRPSNSDHPATGGIVRSKSLSPIRRSRSLSPVKEPQTTESFEAPKPIVFRTAQTKESPKAVRPVVSRKDIQYTEPTEYSKPVANPPKPAPKTIRPTVSPSSPGSRQVAIHPNLERSPYAMSIATADPIRLKMTHANSANGKTNKKGKTDKNDRGN